MLWKHWTVYRITTMRLFHLLFRTIYACVPKCPMHIECIYSTVFILQPNIGRYVCMYTFVSMNETEKVLVRPNIRGCILICSTKYSGNTVNNIWVLWWNIGSLNEYSCMCVYLWSVNNTNTSIVCPINLAAV